VFNQVQIKLKRTTIMNEDEIRVAILSEPFSPVRIHMSDGKTLDVARPGSIAIGRVTSGVVVGGMIHTISNLQITRIEPLETAAAH
jgi:hypothetical protein